MALLNRPWQLHDVADVEGLLRAALNACEFSAGLRPHQRDDCIAYLFEIAWRAADDYDAGRGRVAFASLLYRRAQARAVDWYRDERGRTIWKFRGRVHERRLPQFVGIDGLDDSEPALASDPEASGDPDWGRLLAERDRRRAWDYELLGLARDERATG